MEKVIITGGTGAIGVALADKLTNSGCKVYVVARPGSSNINNLKKHKNLKIIECDIANLLTLENKLGKEFDAFYHLAWNGTVGSSRNSHELQLNNIKYTMDATVLAKKLNCKVFLGAGSQAEYGHFNTPADEKTLTKPFTLYGAAKLSAAQMSRVLADNISIKHIWTRIFSIYGPGDDFNTLISYVINELKNNRVPKVTKCEQIWDYLYSYDAAEAMILLAQYGKNGETYCIGSGEKRSLKDYIQDILEGFDSAKNIDFGKPYSKNQVMFLSANIEKLKKDTGFIPEYKFKEGIKKLIAGGEIFEN